MQVAILLLTLSSFVHLSIGTPAPISPSRFVSRRDDDAATHDVISKGVKICSRGSSAGECTTLYPTLNTCTPMPFSDSVMVTVVPSKGEFCFVSPDPGPGCKFSPNLGPMWDPVGYDVEGPAFAVDRLKGFKGFFCVQ